MLPAVSADPGSPGNEPVIRIEFLATRHQTFVLWTVTEMSSICGDFLWLGDPVLTDMDRMTSFERVVNYPLP